MARLVPHRTTLQSPQGPGNYRAVDDSRKPDPPKMVCIGPVLPTLSLPHAGQLGSSQTDEVLPFLQLPQAIVVIGPPGMLDTLVSVPNPSGWATSPEGPESHSLQARVWHSLAVTRHLYQGFIMGANKTPSKDLSYFVSAEFGSPGAINIGSSQNMQKYTGV